MLISQWNYRGSAYKRMGIYSATRPSINDPTSANIVTLNSDENKYEDRNGFRIKNSAVLKVPGYDYKFCIITDGGGYIVYFENGTPYYNSTGFSSVSGKGLYSTPMTVQTINGVSFPYNEYLNPDDKSDVVINPEIPLFTDPAQFVAYITGVVQPPYNWQSVPSISGKNGILQSLVQIKDSAINDGEPVSEATVLSFDSLGNINIPSVIDEQMPVDPSDVTSVTATYLIPALENGTYEGIKLLVKKGSIPTSEQDADKVVNLDEPTSILRIDSKSVGNLDEDSHYYFVVKLVDEIGTEATSEPKDIWTSHSEGWNFDYTGSIQTFTAPKTGIYSLETWGAQGGDATDGTLTARGGYGAYAYGEVLLQQGDTLYINVGGQNGYGGGGGFNPYRQVNSWEASDGNTYDCLKINDYSIIPQSIKDSTTMTYSKLTNGGSLPSYIEEQGDLIHTSVYSDIANNIQINYCDNEKLKIILGKYYSTETSSRPFYGVGFYDVRVSASSSFCGEGWIDSGSTAIASYIGIVLDMSEHRGYIIWDAYLTNHPSRNGHNIYVVGGKSNGVDIIWETFKNG